MEALLTPVIGKLTELLIEEVKSLKGIHGEVESLKEELEIILLLLRDAEAKSEKGETSEAVKAWVNQICVQADRIEDLVDNYRYHIIKLQNKKGLTGYLRRVKYMKPRRKIASEIQIIKRSLNAIKGRGKGYGLKPPDRVGSSRGFASEERVDPRLESLFVEEEEVVGIESLKDEIVEKLVQGPSEFLVISLVGQGGVGKTTLAKKVLDDGAVMRRFEYARAWVTVSQPYNLKKILVSLMVKLQVGSWEESDAVEDLIGRLRTHLRTNRYAIVFDDVWDERFWDEIKFAVPPNSEGSRIMITTRNSSIANHCKNSPHDIVQHIKPWPQKLAFELFCKKAFGTKFPGSCPEELLVSSMEIVSKCQGLPLVIGAIAGLLKTKENTIFEWEKVLRDLNSKVELSSELTRVHKMLSLSYHDMPHNLRPCFTYICLFPEDYSIADERLYRLWIAEGFVKAKGRKTPEEVAEEYMTELVRRNLVSLDQFKVIIGQGNFFRVHDLMRDVILLRIEQLNFYQIWDEKALKFRGNGRRLMISGDAGKALETLETSSVRSLFLSHTTDDQLTDSFMASLFQKFKLLEVLDLESSRIKSLPKELGKMLCLKYLSLWKTNVKSLPKSIGRLRNLYSLDIRDTSILELPKEINKLRNLQHILAYRESRNHTASLDSLIGVRLHKGFGENFKSLQTLVSVEANPGGGAPLTRALENLGELRWLEFVRLTADMTTALCSVIGKLNRLERLTLISVSEDEPLPLQHVSPPPPELRAIVLAGRLDRLPRWISELRNLRGLALTSLRLTESPIEALKDSPNLETLYLGRNAYEGEELHFKEGGFRGLKALILYKLGNLKAVKIDDGALVVLHQLEIYDCLALQEVSSLHHLKNLNYATANGKHII